MVRVDPEIMEKLDLKPGDVVEIAGKSKAYATVLRGYLEDKGRG
ncbi:hypothetical protein KKP89_00665, partial [Methanothermococcus sp. SCGC AD-155-N22]|nr:hypothetical protein [Methanothermococcus sp. SCGC AD-155-N22]